MPQYYIILMIAGPLIAALTGFYSGKINYKKDIRITSGNIDTTDARTIWEQTNKLLQDLRLEVNRLTEANKKLEEAKDKIEDEARELRTQVDRLTQEVTELRLRLGA